MMKQHNRIKFNPTYLGRQVIDDPTDSPFTRRKYHPRGK